MIKKVLWYNIYSIPVIVTITVIIIITIMKELSSRRGFPTGPTINYFY